MALRLVVQMREGSGFRSVEHQQRAEIREGHPETLFSLILRLARILEATVSCWGQGRLTASRAPKKVAGQSGSQKAVAN